MNSEEALSNLLRQLEERLLRPEVRHSPEELEKLLAEEFIEFGSSGRVYDRTSIIRELGGEGPIRIEIADFKVCSLDRDTVLVTYLALVDEANCGPACQSLRSSIWSRKHGSWQMVFHQGTPSSPAAD